MSNEQIRNHGVDAHGSFEHQDLSPKGVLYFFLGLGVFMVVIYFIAFGIYHVLNAADQANQKTMSPMVAPKADTRAVTPSDIHAFPDPRLEEHERTQLRSFIEDEDGKLATYNWVDKDKGVVQIPIERAMELIVQRGLPVRSQVQEAQGRGAQGQQAETHAEASEQAQPQTQMKDQR
jgi:hypothetical protein